MKKLPSVKALLAIIAILLVNVITIEVMDGSKKASSKGTIVIQSILLANNSFTTTNSDEVNNELLAVNVANQTQEKEIVYDGLTLNELAAKLEKNLKSTLNGYGMTFAKLSMKYEVDPYLALAIVLHETGCASGKCSTLTSKCNNVGGMKGSHTCGNSSYAKFRTLDAGLEAFFKNLSNNYYKKGLRTPEAIGKKYAESSTWAKQVRNYIQKIKKS